MPSRIDAEERVWLTLDHGSADATVRLNEQLLGTRPSNGYVEYDVTRVIQRRNELFLEIERDCDSSEAVGDIALEIRRAAFLRNVAFQVDKDQHLRVSGEVVGDADGELDLYVLADNRTVSYAKVASAPAGMRFEVRSDTAVSSPMRECRVELVCGAVVWYRVDAEG
jgi:hypothetical protein